MYSFLHLKNTKLENENQQIEVGKSMEKLKGDKVDLKWSEGRKVLGTRLLTFSKLASGPLVLFLWTHCPVPNNGRLAQTPYE